MLRRRTPFTLSEVRRGHAFPRCCVRACDSIRLFQTTCSPQLWCGAGGGVPKPNHVSNPEIKEFKPHLVYDWLSGGFIVLGAFFGCLISSFVGYRIHQRAEKHNWGKYSAFSVVVVCVVCMAGRETWRLFFFGIYLQKLGTEKSGIFCRLWLKI